MKKIFLFFILSLFFIFLVSAGLFTPETWEEKFENDPEEAWMEFKNNPDVWKDASAVESAFKTDPKRAIESLNENLFKEYDYLSSINPVNQTPFLIDVFGVKELIEEQIKQNPGIINDNLYIKREWFAQKGVFDEGAEIESYDGAIIKTKGEESTTFNITDEIFYGAKILPSGKLVLKDGIEISSSNILRAKTGELIFQGGQVDLSSLSEMEFSMKEGSIKIREKIYSSGIDETFYVISKEGFIMFKGDEIIEKDFFEATLSKFTGILKTNGYKVLGESTKYTLFFNGTESRTYNVNKETKFRSIEGDCGSSSISCIEEFSNQEGKKEISIIPKENNLIELKFFDNSVDNLKIEGISDNSSVIFNDNENVELTFTKSPLKLRGNFNQLSTNVESFFANSKEEIHKLSIKNGVITKCSYPCKEISLFSFLVKPRLDELLYTEEGKKYEKQIQEKYGDSAKLWYLNSLIVNGNPRVYKSVISSSQGLYERTGKYISPEFVYVGAVAEGFDNFIKYNKLDDEVDGFANMGLDSFGDNAPVLRDGKYLPFDFNEGDEYSTREVMNENMDVFNTGIFDKLEYAFIAKTAEYAWRQDIFLKDLEKIGIDKEGVSQDAINFWTYIYYNAGQAAGKQMLNSYHQKGYLKKDNYIWKRPDDSWKNPYLFANRRMANLKLIQESEMPFLN